PCQNWANRLLKEPLRAGWKKSVTKSKTTKRWRKFLPRKSTPKSHRLSPEPSWESRRRKTKTLKSDKSWRLLARPMAPQPNQKLHRPPLKRKLSRLLNRNQPQMNLSQNPHRNQRQHQPRQQKPPPLHRMKHHEATDMSPHWFVVWHASRTSIWNRSPELALADAAVSRMFLPLPHSKSTNLVRTKHQQPQHQHSRPRRALRRKILRLQSILPNAERLRKRHAFVR